MPTVPFGKAPVPSTSAAGLMVMLIVGVIVCVGFPASWIVTTGVLVPAVVGVPVTAQPAPSASPAGNVPDESVQV